MVLKSVRGSCEQQMEEVPSSRHEIIQKSSRLPLFSPTHFPLNPVPPTLPPPIQIATKSNLAMWQRQPTLFPFSDNNNNSRSSSSSSRKSPRGHPSFPQSPLQIPLAKDRNHFSLGRQDDIPFQRVPPLSQLSPGANFSSSASDLMIPSGSTRHGSPLMLPNMVGTFLPREYNDLPSSPPLQLPPTPFNFQSTSVHSQQTKDRSPLHVDISRPSNNEQSPNFSTQPSLLDERMGWDLGSRQGLVSPPLYSPPVLSGIEHPEVSVKTTFLSLRPDASESGTREASLRPRLRVSLSDPAQKKHEIPTMLPIPTSAPSRFRSRITTVKVEKDLSPAVTLPRSVKKQPISPAAPSSKRVSRSSSSSSSVSTSSGQKGARVSRKAAIDIGNRTNNKPFAEADEIRPIVRSLLRDEIWPSFDWEWRKGNGLNGKGEPIRHISPTSFTRMVDLLCAQYSNPRWAWESQMKVVEKNHIDELVKQSKRKAPGGKVISRKRRRPGKGREVSGRTEKRRKTKATEGGERVRSARILKVSSSDRIEDSKAIGAEYKVISSSLPASSSSSSSLPSSSSKNTEKMKGSSDDETACAGCGEEVGGCSEIKCVSCPRVVHRDCIAVSSSTEVEWFCHDCRAKQRKLGLPEVYSECDLGMDFEDYKSESEVLEDGVAMSDDARGDHDSNGAWSEGECFNDEQNDLSNLATDLEKEIPSTAPSISNSGHGEQGSSAEQVEAFINNLPTSSTADSQTNSLTSVKGGAIDSELPSTSTRSVSSSDSLCSSSLSTTGNIGISSSSGISGSDTSLASGSDSSLTSGSDTSLTSGSDGSQLSTCVSGHDSASIPMIGESIHVGLWSMHRVGRILEYTKSSSPVDPALLMQTGLLHLPFVSRAVAQRGHSPIMPVLLVCWNNILGDCVRGKLDPNKSPPLYEDVHLFKQQQGESYWVKFRPGLGEFLEVASTLFHVYIYAPLPDTILQSMRDAIGKFGDRVEILPLESTISKAQALEKELVHVDIEEGAQVCVLDCDLRFLQVLQSMYRAFDVLHMKPYRYFHTDLQKSSSPETSKSLQCALEHLVRQSNLAS